jgi:hypothetical protein
MSSQLTNLTMYKPRKEYNQIERAIYSCSVEFWLSLATITILANLMFKFGVESVVMMVIWAAIIGVYGLYANEFCAKTWSGFRRIRCSGKQLQLILLGVGSICAICSLLFFTTPAHALILDNKGAGALIGIMDNTTSVTDPTFATLISTTGGKIVILIKAAFLLASVLIGLASIEKFRERAEWSEIVIPPAVFLVIVGFVDTIVGKIMA